ncbi:MAG: hypothetical protein GF364_04220 [Candidatus Lokiarchaeota archaeon]|nr:hypothetical protein [Candidatus Lokiarchaeota archaeon]
MENSEKEIKEPEMKKETYQVSVKSVLLLLLINSIAIIFFFINDLIIDLIPVRIKIAIFGLAILCLMITMFYKIETQVKGKKIHYRVYREKYLKLITAILTLYIILFAVYIGLDVIMSVSGDPFLEDVFNEKGRFILNVLFLISIAFFVNFLNHILINMDVFLKGGNIKRRFLYIAYRPENPSMIIISIIIELFYVGSCVILYILGYFNSSSYSGINFLVLLTIAGVFVLSLLKYSKTQKIIAFFLANIFVFIGIDVLPEGLIDVLIVPSLALHEIVLFGILNIGMTLLASAAYYTKRKSTLWNIFIYNWIIWTTYLAVSLVISVFLRENNITWEFYFEIYILIGALIKSSNEKEDLDEDN